MSLEPFALSGGVQKALRMADGILVQEIDHMQDVWDRRDTLWRASHEGVHARQFVEQLRMFAAVMDDILAEPSAEVGYDSRGNRRG